MADTLIDSTLDACDLARIFNNSLEFSRRVIVMTQIFRSLTGHDMEQISGYRTCRQQEALGARGRPAAPCDISTHTSCPATGGDFRLGGLFDSDFVKAQFGSAAIQAGLRWGGGSPERDVQVAPGVTLKIPSDWNHLDLGRRK